MKTCAAHVTPAPWSDGLQHARYGAEETYRRAAAWLACCATVSDWGGSTGFFGTCLPRTTVYTVVDGTQQRPGQVLADLTAYRTPSDGILLRHVLELNLDWRAILHNALGAFRRRLVVITFTEPSPDTHVVKQKTGWPVQRFNLDDLRREMGALLVREEAVMTSHDEHLFYLERP